MKSGNVMRLSHKNVANKTVILKVTNTFDSGEEGLS